MSTSTINEILLNLQENNSYFLFFENNQEIENDFTYDCIEIIPSNLLNYFFINLINLKYSYSDCTKKPVVKEFIGEFLKLKGINISEKTTCSVEKCSGVKENPKLIEPKNGEEEEKLVYFIQSNTQGAIKIGASADPEARLEALLPSLPFVELKLLATIEGGYKKESELHKKFDTYRIKNEWFRPSNELLSYIEQIKGEKEL